MASPPSEIFRVSERTASDKVTTVIATRNADGQERMDIISPDGRQNNIQRYSRKFLDVFLPAGYPASVTEDYTQYQIYDSIQASLSSIAGLLSDRAILQGLGVGDATASTTAAIVLGVVQGSIGRMTTIAFAHRFGTVLEPECKMYRLLADVVNDAAIVLECASVAFSKPVRVGILALATSLKSICGVAAGGTKACLSAHFAKDGNLADVNAKDGSQETAVNLVTMWIGAWFISRVTSPTATSLWLILLLSMHLACNHRAVRSVVITYLNRQRANIVFSQWTIDGRVLTPKEVARKERVFDVNSIRDGDRGVLGTCRIGVSFQTLSSEVESCCQRARGPTNSVLRELIEISESNKASFILWTDLDTRRACIVLREGCTPDMQLLAWYTAFTALKCRGALEGEGAARITATLKRLEAAHVIAQRQFPALKRGLEQAGWRIADTSLQTSDRNMADWQLAGTKTTRVSVHRD